MVSKIGVRQVYHLLVFAFYLYFDIFVVVKIISNVSKIEGLKDIYHLMSPQFATIWSQFVVQDYFLLSFLEDLLAFTPKSFLSSFKQILSDHANDLLIFFAFPVNLVSCTNFWVLFSINPRLIDEYHVLFDSIDHSTNHAVHTYVIAIMLVEMCLTYRRYPDSVTTVHPYRKMAITCASYWTVVFGMKLFSPIWPYPYLKAMSPLLWTGYILGNMALAFFGYALSFFFNSLIWGKGTEGNQHVSVKQEGWKMTSGWSQVSQMIQVIQNR